LLKKKKTALADAFDETSETVKEEYQDLVKRSTLTILGQGIIGNIVSDQTTIEYGAVLINTDNEKEFRITNPSKCDIDYDIKIYKVKKITLSEEEKKKIIQKRQEKIRKRIMEEERKKNETDSKENTTNESKGGELDKAKPDGLNNNENNNNNNNNNININGNAINNDVFDFNNYMKTMDDNMDYIDEKDYEKEELVDKNDTGIY